MTITFTPEKRESMKFIADRRARIPSSITGKQPDADSSTYSLREISTIITEQIAGLTREEILAQGWLHEADASLNLYVDGWSGAEGRLIDEA